MDSFSQAPDYASELEKSFQSYNASLNRNEEMERQNDQRRIQGAGIPLEVIKGLANFSITAKKAFENYRNKIIDQTDSKINTPEEDEEIKQNIDELNNFAKIDQTVKGEARKNNDTDLVELINKRSGALSFRKQAETLKYASHTEIPKLLRKYESELENARDEQDVKDVFVKLTEELKSPYLNAGKGFNRKLISYYFDKNIRSHEQKELIKKNKQLSELQNSEEQELMSKSLFNILKGDNLEEIEEFVNVNEGYFFNGKGGANDFVIENATKFAELGLIPTDTVRALWSRVVKPDGEKEIKLNEKFPLKYEINLKDLDDIDAQNIKEKEDEIKTKQKLFEDDFKSAIAEAEKNNEPLTNEYIEALKTAWVEQGLGTRDEASFLDDYSTQQERDYDEDKAYIEGVIAARKSYGGHLYDSDFDGMGNKIKAEYASQVKLSSSTLTPDSTILSGANDEVLGAVNDRHIGQFGRVVKGRKYKRELRRGKEQFLVYYSEAIGKGNVSPEDARDLALQKVQKDLDGDRFTKEMDNPTVDFDIQQQIDLKDARQSILDDPNIINTGVPDGLANYIPDLVRIQKAGRGEIPQIFGLLAANTPYTKWQLANKILTNATGSGFIIPAAELDVENLPTYQQELLNKYSSASRTSRVIADQPKVTNMFLDPKTAIYDEDFYAFETMDGTLSNFGSFTIGDIFNSDNVQKVGAHLIPIEDLYAVFEMTGLSMDDQFGPEEQQKFVKTIANAKANSNNILNGLNTEWTGLSVVPDELFEGMPETYKDKFDMSTILPDVLNDFPLLR